MCLFLPPSDLTIFVEVERNPGPCCPTLNSTAHFTTSSYNVRGLNLRHQKHYQPSCISYERNRLLSLRHWSKHYCSPAFLGKLKAMDLLRYLGKRAGRLHKQKSTGNGLRIPVICSGRRHYHASLNIQNATSTSQICKSRPLGVNVNNLIYIRPDPFQSNLSTVVPLDFCLLNSRSICNKSRLINDHNVDFFALSTSETWLRGDDSDLYYIRDICPDGYVFHHVPRLHTTGGGVGIVLKNNIKAKIQVQESYCSFEHLELELRAMKCFIRLIVLYRPPSSDVSLFFDEFASYLAHILTASGHLLIVGDYNFHVDSQNNTGRRFIGLLHSFNLHQHVNDSTHKNGHTLDLVITREEQSFIKNLLVFDPALSDHFMIQCNLDFFKPVAQGQELSFRRLRAIDMNKFSSDLEDSALIRSPLNDDLSLAIDQLNSTLQAIIDNHAPIIRRSVTLHPYAPWFTDEIKVAKRKRRKLERRWRTHNTEANYLLYTEHCREVNDLIRCAKENHFSSLIESNQGDQKMLFQTVNNLLYRKPIVRYPFVGSDMAIAEKFKSFFIDKIRLIRDSLPVHSTDFRMSPTWITLRLNSGLVNLRLFNVFLPTL